MTPTYPRVLHVGFNPIGSPTNTGLTLGSMFGRWPREQLLQVYTMSRQEYVPGERVIVTPPSTAPIDGAVRWLLRSRLPIAVGDGLNTAISRRDVPTPWPVRARVALTMLNDLGPVWVRGSWARSVDAWRPDVIHSLLGGVRITRLVLALSKRLDVPVVPHFMDDWLATLFADGQLLGLGRREVDRLVEQVLARSPLCIAIGRDMQAEYSRRLDRDCRVVGNSVDFDAYQALPSERDSRDGSRVISYIGGLHLGRTDVLRKVGTALAQVHGDWRLRISVPRADLDLARALGDEVASIEVGESLRPDDVPAALVDSDGLLFVESSDPHIARFTRLSVSTKVPEYLAAGRPVLAVGPAEQASVRSLMRSGVAHYGGDGHETEALVSGLKALDAAASSGEPHGTVGPELRAEFGIGPTQERLRLALLDASGLS